MIMRIGKGTALGTVDSVSCVGDKVVDWLVINFAQ